MSEEMFIMQKIRQWELMPDANHVAMQTTTKCMKVLRCKWSGA